MGCNSIVQKTLHLLRFITSLEIQKDRQVVYLFMAAFPLKQDSFSLNPIVNQGFLRQNQTVKDECLLNFHKGLGSQNVINRLSQ